MYYLLFTTSSCPKCPRFKEAAVEKLSFPGRILQEQDPDFSKFSSEFSIGSVPTLIVFEDQTMESAVLRTSELADLYSYVKDHVH